MGLLHVTFALAMSVASPPAKAAAPAAASSQPATSARAAKAAKAASSKTQRPAPERPTAKTCSLDQAAEILGPAAAPIVIGYYFDPTESYNYDSYLSLRRLVADAGGSLRVDLIPVRSSALDALHRDRVRTWFLAAAALSRSERALRILIRDGQERVETRIARPDQRAALAQELAVTEAELTAALADPCVARRLESNTRAYRDELTRAGGRLARPPIFTVAGAVAVDKRSSLYSMITRAHNDLYAPKPGLGHRARPPRRGVSPRVIYPPGDAGLLVGGVGAPHRLAYFINPEPKPRLGRLKPALEFQRRHPDRLAIQIIVRGSTATAELLRRRFCAAKRAGVELELLRVLAELPSGAEADPRKAAELLMRKLDNAPDLESCDVSEPNLPTAEDEDAPTQLPEGIWLDGAVINSTSDLELIELRLREIEASADPLDLVFSLIPESDD